MSGFLHAGCSYRNVSSWLPAWDQSQWPVNMARDKWSAFHRRGRGLGKEDISNLSQDCFWLLQGT